MANEILDAFHTGFSFSSMRYMRGKVARKSWKEKEREVEEEKSERRTNPDPPCLFMKQKEARVRKQS